MQTMFRFNGLRCAPRQPASLRCLAGGIRYNSSTFLVTKLREEMKAAMRARDKARLNVIKSVIADINNPSHPVSQDSQVLALIKKRKSAAEVSIEMYKEADRSDLVESTKAESSILTELSNMIPQMDDAELEAHVVKAINVVIAEDTSTNPNPNFKPNPGSIFKVLFGNNGSIKDATVDKKKVTEILKKLTENK